MVDSSGLVLCEPIPCLSLIHTYTHIQTLSSIMMACEVAARSDDVPPLQNYVDTIYTFRERISPDKITWRIHLEAWRTGTDTYSSEWKRWTTLNPRGTRCSRRSATRLVGSSGALRSSMRWSTSWSGWWEPCRRRREYDRRQWRVVVDSRYGRMGS